MPPRPTSSTLQTNEGKACDAVIRVMEERSRAQRSDLWSPEHKADPDPVDFAINLGQQLVVMEHTVIEPFDGYMHLSAQGETHFDPIVDLVSDHLPTPDHYELQIPAGALRHLHRRELRAVQERLAAFVIAQAPHLPLHRLGHWHKPMKCDLPGVPFPVMLHRVERLGPRQARFTVVQVVDHTLEDQREARLRQTCAKKFPKLANWRAKAGARAVLVLEVNDMILTNAEYAWRAYAKAESEFPNPPDDVYLVITFIPEMWWVVPLRLGARTYFDLGIGERMSEWDSAQLADLRASLRPPA